MIQYRLETRAGRQDVVELNPHVVRDPGDEVVQLTAPHADVAVLKS